MTNAEAAHALTGAWRLERFTLDEAGGDVALPLGPAPSGQISYGADGHMSAHLVKGEGATGATPMSPYAAYYGRFSVDAGRAVVTHHVDGASIPGLAGTDQPRHFRFEGDRLILSAAQSQGRAELVWRRLRPSGLEP